MVTKRPTGKDLRGYRKRGWWTLTPWLWHSLSPHSVCKKSPSLLAALLPLPDLSLKQCQKWVQPCAGKGRFPGEIRPKKECINSCETCFANTLNLNDKGLSLKWVCFPKSYSPLANWLWLRISPQSSLFVINCLILTAWQWLMSFTCIPVQIEPNKSPMKKRLLALLLWEIGHLSSPSRSCLGRLILIRGGQSTPTPSQIFQNPRPKPVIPTYLKPLHHDPSLIKPVHWKASGYQPTNVISIQTLHFPLSDATKPLPH